MKTTENKPLRKNFIKCLVILLVFAGVGTILFVRWSGGVFLPRWITWQNSTIEDASGEYKIILERKKVSVARGDVVIWTSQDDVKVQKALSCDIDNDGQDELVLLCWKKGHYGDVKPIWVEEDKQEWVQHIFVYEYTQDDARAKWMSSCIGRDILDINAGKTASSACCLCLTDTEGEISNWVWDSWGFTKIEN